MSTSSFGSEKETKRRKKSGFSCYGAGNVFAGREMLTVGAVSDVSIFGPGRPGSTPARRHYFAGLKSKGKNFSARCDRPG